MAKRVAVYWPGDARAKPNELAIPSIEAANRGVVAAEEGLRITKIVFAVGNGTGTALADAETAVTTARLRKLAAHVGLQAALVRLEHATGRNRGVVLAKK